MKEDVICSSSQTVSFTQINGGIGPKNQSKVTALSPWRHLNLNKTSFCLSFHLGLEFRLWNSQLIIHEPSTTIPGKQSYRGCGLSCSRERKRKFGHLLVHSSYNRVSTHLIWSFFVLCCQRFVDILRCYLNVYVEHDPEAGRALAKACTVWQSCSQLRTN